MNPLEVARLRHHASQLRAQLRHTRADNAHLRELLRRASSYVKAVADDDEMRLEMPELADFLTHVRDVLKQTGDNDHALAHNPDYRRP